MYRAITRFAVLPIVMAICACAGQPQGAGAAQVSGIDQEDLTMEFEAITFSGTTAVIYYGTHRTRMPDGEAVDQRFDIVHVWVREEGAWKLLGAMGRTKPPPGA